MARLGRAQHFKPLIQGFNFKTVPTPVIDRPRGFSMGKNNDTNTGIGKRSTHFLGRNNDTNTGIGTRLK